MIDGKRKSQVGKLVKPTKLFLQGNQHTEIWVFGSLRPQKQQLNHKCSKYIPLCIARISGHER